MESKTYENEKNITKTSLIYFFKVLPPIKRKQNPFSKIPAAPTQSTGIGWCISSKWSMWIKVWNASIKTEKQRDARKTQQKSMERTSMRAQPKVFFNVFSCCSLVCDDFMVLVSRQRSIGSAEGSSVGVGVELFEVCWSLGAVVSSQSSFGLSSALWPC